MGGKDRSTATRSFLGMACASNLESRAKAASGAGASTSAAEGIAELSHSIARGSDGLVSKNTISKNIASLDVSNFGTLSAQAQIAGNGIFPNRSSRHKP